MFAVAAVALTGCAGIATQPSLSSSNPSSPTASEAGYPIAMPVLMTGTNFAMSPQAEGQPASPHEGTQHKMNPDKPMQHEH